ncbi:hypothetical protein GCM10007877_31730 [Marinibactrum halimedae]|uniref:Uncharacterized protein n=1 Tax=Marinibactrum halimedae TaxID=1444977 RepID=A0AA37WMU0_9GAMM|nr:hypothetical protein GCM10007877_31730 [Marinibactrum halimedae]
MNRDSRWNALATGLALWFIQVLATSAKANFRQPAVNILINVSLRVDKNRCRDPVGKIAAVVGVGGEKSQIGHVNASLRGYVYAAMG